MLLALGLLGSLAVAVILQNNVRRCIAVSEIKMPCEVEQTALTVLELRSYDGPFLEDGSRRQVEGVAALVLYNRGKQLLERGAVKL